MARQLKEIGNTVFMNKHIDQELRMSSYIRASMPIIDLIPIKQTINVMNISTNNINAVTFDFTSAISQFKRTCRSYGLDQFDGLRVYCTDETVIQDEFSNQFNESYISSIINNLSNKAASFKYINALSGMQKSETNVNSAVQNAINTIASTAEKVAGGAAGQVVRTASDIILKGERLSLPKVWQDSTYNPAISMNIKLVSPYGHPTAIKRFIIKPLAYILALVSPITDNGLTYGYAPTIFVRAYGIAKMRAGFIESVSVNRGGADLVYNQFRQPQILNITLSVRPLTEGFACIQNSNFDVNMTDQYADNENTIGQSTMNTLEDILTSLRPYRGNSSTHNLNLENNTSTQHYTQNNIPPQTNTAPTGDGGISAGVSNAIAIA